jgi:hypothetical protein
VGTGLDDGQWHHYVVTFMRGTGVMEIVYLDGADIYERPLPSTGNINSDPCNLATNIFQDGTGIYTDGVGGTNWDKASIDDLGIWRRAYHGRGYFDLYDGPPGQVGPRLGRGLLLVLRQRWRR